ncbi:MAG TPA: sigma-70 family RNA polymerase sigma factor [Kofleriaceae bacterium]|nr:sigma-70 family RNA polymerase sigma factor [Kofleriaceae bacterium]
MELTRKRAAASDSPGPPDLETIYREHGHVVVRRARRILGDEVEAGEILQEVFLSLLDRPDQFEGRSAVTTFLYAMTTNACLNRLRDRRRRSQILAEAIVPLEIGSGGRPEASLDAASLLARLPERLARVAIYHFLDGMTHDEIAELIGVSRRQVGNLVVRVQEEARRLARAA